MSYSHTSNQPNSSKKVTPLRILHTSDWHLGRRLYGRMRYDEFAAFLQWLIDTIKQYDVDIVIVAGDIFDTMTPSNKAQALYYDFLGQVSRLDCQHIVIVAGNHDSPTFLDAPSDILKFLNVHVIGTACDNPDDEVLVLNNAANEPQCIIAAVPYLRDRDVRSSIAGESADSKDANVIAGIREHYAQVAACAKAYQAKLCSNNERHIPIIATGHLFTAGGKTTEDDGVRDLYIGSLGKVSSQVFDACFDYVALGHLHVPQKVSGCEHIRYSGSPIAMGFGEARQQKQVLLVCFASDELTANALSTAGAATKQSTAHVAKSQPIMDDLFGFDTSAIDNAAFDNNTVDNVIVDNDIIDNDVVNNANSNESNDAVHSSADGTKIKHLYSNADNNMQLYAIAVPCLQPLAQISGNLQQISDAITQVISQYSASLSATLSNSSHSDTSSITTSDTIWLEVIYTGDEVVSDLREYVNELVADLPCEVLKIKNNRTYNRVLQQHENDESLQDLDTREVFERCLTIHQIAETQKPELRHAYEQILYDIEHEDKQAE